MNWVLGWIHSKYGMGKTCTVLGDKRRCEVMKKAINLSNFLVFVAIVLIVAIPLSGLVFPKPTLQKLFDSYIKGDYLFTLQDNNSTQVSEPGKLLNPDFVRYPVLYSKNKLIICREVERQNILLEHTLKGEFIAGTLVDPNTHKFLVIEKVNHQKHLHLFEFEKGKLLLERSINIGNDDFLFYHYPNYYTITEQIHSVNIYNELFEKDKTIFLENRNYRIVGVVRDYLFAYDGRNLIDLLSKKKFDIHFDGVLDKSKVLMFSEDDLIKFEYLFYDGKRIWTLDRLFSDYYTNDQARLPNPVLIEKVTDGFSSNVVCTENGVYVVELIGNTMCKFKLSNNNYKPLFGIMHNPFNLPIFSSPYKLYVLVNYTSTSTNILAYSYDSRELVKQGTYNTFAKLNLNIGNIASFFVNEKIIGMDYVYKNNSHSIKDFVCFSEDKVFRVVEHGSNSVFYGFNYLW